uniref:uncharacterized protein n=1 Tax=Centroberyx gerrardi TaxID=166262 RepID=UPI003AAD0872
MASLCKRQQCTIERRGFRQELDSWRHKLIHCVGFESILEGLFGPELVEDLKLFHDCEPEAVSDWSFDENCLFCCLRRDKVKEHLVGLSNQGLEDTPKALLVKDQTKINRLEKQAEEFLNAVLCRKDVPSFSDPHIPVVAREIMQRMIRQFAAEYTSKTSSPQDSGSDPQPCSDQSLPRPPSFSGAPPSTSPAATLAASAHNQNPVLSKLLMADQDAPLDLTVKKPPAEPSEQEGVLDLSLKKNRYSSSLPAHSPYLSPTTSTLKGRSLRADGQVGLFMRSLQDGRRRENIGHSTHYKPSQPLAYSLHIKEEVGLAQESDPESPPSHNHSSTPTDLFRNGSASWNTKTHFGALLKLRTNSEASEYLKDLPRLLEAAGLFSKSLSSDKGTIQEARGDQGLSLSPSSSFDLKIPRVRGLSTGTDQSWGSLSSEFSGSLCENGLGKRLRSILPKHGRKGSNGGLDGPGAEKEYWAYDTDRQALGGNYPALDSESDLGNKQPRKKRGRYRQYNTELLEEAIVVVMGGKMSVSKAQSIYGIPHSTLEYKVKERLGTLKHPPKKKLRLLSQVEEQDVSQFPEGHGLQNLQHNESEKRECASTDYGSELFDAGLSPDDESPDLSVTKAKDLQSTSTLEQFMAKLCPHHQRQIVDALGFLQTEVKALASSSALQASNSTSGIQGATCSNATSSLDSPEKSCPELRLPIASTPKVPETAISLKTSIIAGSPLDLRRPGSGSIQALVTPIPDTLDAENNRHSDHAPLKMKIMKTSNLADGKKMSCVLTTSLLTNSGTLEERQGNPDSPNRTEAHSARLSSSVKRHSQSGHAHQARQRDSLGHTKDTPAKPFSVHKTFNTIPPDSPRTARKTIRGSSDHRPRDSACRVIADPDLGHCDIVYIDKPITECLREQQRHMLPRRNARKSTRGHMYVEEMWELKTVRTLAGRNEKGNCPNPMPELITLVTPKQVLAKPDGVPPVDMPLAGGCGETISQQMPTEESDEREIPGTGDVVEAAASEPDLIVETSQTDQCQSKEQSAPPSPLSSPTEKIETDVNADVVQDVTTDSGQTGESGESVDQAPFEAEKDNQEPEEALNESTEQVVAETIVEPSEIDTIDEAEPQLVSAEAQSSESEQHQSDTLVPPVVNTVEEETEEKTGESKEDEQAQELQLETQNDSDNFEVTEKSSTTSPAEEEIVTGQEINTVEPVNSVAPVETEDDDEGTSQGVFPSLQAERLKKHLKKFAIASPVKSNPKSQKLIAKALEQEANVVKGKEKRELPNATQTLTKPYCSSVEAQVPIREAQKASAKSKNPASARILRKYSNIREKMQVQQSNVRLKEAPAKRLKATSMKTLTTSKSASKSNLKSALKGQKSRLPESSGTHTDKKWDSKIHWEKRSGSLTVTKCDPKIGSKESSGVFRNPS